MARNHLLVISCESKSAPPKTLTRVRLRTENTCEDPTFWPKTALFSVRFRAKSPWFWWILDRNLPFYPFGTHFKRIIALPNVNIPSPFPLFIYFNRKPSHFIHISYENITFSLKTLKPFFTSSSFPGRTLHIFKLSSRTLSKYPKTIFK